MNVEDKTAVLLENIQARLTDLAALLEESSSHWLYEDLVYRFYYQSFKVYGLQAQTAKIVQTLRSLAPDGQGLSTLFEEICQAGAGQKQFAREHNREWTTHTRVFVEAFFHAKFFLEMAVKYGKELESAPTALPSGWAALLCLYQIR